MDPATDRPRSTTYGPRLFTSKPTASARRDAALAASPARNGDVARQMICWVSGACRKHRAVRVGTAADSPRKLFDRGRGQRRHVVKPRRPCTQARSGAAAIHVAAVGRYLKDQKTERL